MDMTNRCVNIYVYTVYTYIHIMTIEVCDMCMIMTNGCCCKHLWCYGVIVKSFPNPFININRSVAQRHHRFQLQVCCDWSGLPYDSARWLPSPYLTPEGNQRVISIFVIVFVFATVFLSFSYYLLITMNKCLNGHKYQKSLFDVVLLMSLYFSLSLSLPKLTPARSKSLKKLDVNPTISELA